MHHFAWDDDDDVTWHVNHHGDFSGNVQFYNGMERFEVPFELMYELVGRKLISDQIAHLEDQTGYTYMRNLNYEAYK